MQFDSQSIVVLLIVFAASVYVVVQAIKPFTERAKNKCGSSCGGCGTEPTLGKPKAFVASDSLTNYPPQ